MLPVQQVLIFVFLFFFSFGWVVSPLCHENCSGSARGCLCRALVHEGSAMSFCTTALFWLRITHSEMQRE